MRPQRRPRLWLFLSALLLIILCAAARFSTPSSGFVWTPQSFDLPPSIRIYRGTTTGGATVAAWRAEVNLRDEALSIRPHLSTSKSGRDKASAMAREVGALLAINGGYFDMTGEPAKTYSLVLRDGRVLNPQIARVSRPGRQYPVRRSAFAIRNDGTPDIAWIAHRGDAVWQFPAPLPNTPTRATIETFANGQVWPARHAIGAGPVLVHQSRVRVTYDEEVFFGSGFGNATPYARAAIGFTRDRRLVLFVTDESTADGLPGSGLTLRQLADEMLRLGCVEAMNLDGGGSETLVIRGVPVNKPRGEREVTSILAVTR